MPELGACYIEKKKDGGVRIGTSHVASFGALKGRGKEGNELDKVDANCPSESAVIEPICDVAPVIWQSPFHIVIHAPSGPEGAISPPSSSVVKIIGIRFRRCHFDAINI